ncbi:MAG: transketolase, partial [Caulobacterales bacterium]
DVATVLFTQFLKFDAAAPDWADRDRFVLSAGHGSMLLYSLLYLTGNKAMTIEQIKNFRQFGSITAGHPEYGHTPGVETTTGPLGQGISTAVGMAMAERMMNARFGDKLVDHHTYVIASDGDLMEGISHEAISLAGHLKLNKLIVLFDDNLISIDGALDVAESGDQLARFKAAGWDAERIDGHDPEAIAAAIKRAQKAKKPTLIACRTQIGFGAPTLEGTAKTHGSPLGAAEIAACREKLAWPYPAFEVPDHILNVWRAAGERGAATHGAWKNSLKAAGNETVSAFEAAVSGKLPGDFGTKVSAAKKAMLDKPQALASRQASGEALEALIPIVPEMVGGSADLTGSNNTKTKGMEALTPSNWAGRYIHYGVREHGMAAAMNGMALHGGVIPYSGTFLVFTDYCRPAIRLAALMGVRVIHVMTHDSIGLGEDGPTHQPVEHLAALRAIPNLLVFRPADQVEALECWQAALEAKKTPSIIAASRQKLPQPRIAGEPDSGSENLSAKGAYVLRPAKDKEQAVLIATGSEVEIALKAQEKLATAGIGARVVSMPCWELFAAQPQAYQTEVLGGDLPKVAVEAGVEMGWSHWLGPKGAFVGMSGFGASAPYEKLYESFGITADAVVDAVRRLL